MCIVLYTTSFLAELGGVYLLTVVPLLTGIVLGFIANLAGFIS